MKTTVPNYQVRRSSKAKNLRLKVTRDEGLLVVVPKGFDERKIPALLKRKRTWIADAMKRVEETKRFLEPKPADHLPESVKLTALGETWPVEYREDCRRSGLWLRAEGGKLVIVGETLNREAVIRKLKEWLRLRVRENLFPLAESIAAKHRLEISGLFVKSQRTRWASCSAKRNLSLNTKLLFIPPELVRYVIVHELCHTVHMNHSNEFWRLVQAYEPAFRTMDARLREAWKRIPPWLF
ncbi:MAG: M48 family metallopeptidase [Puniceicoccaceae bacterium]